MPRRIIAVLLALMTFAVASPRNAAATSDIPPSLQQLTWSDDFNAPLDPNAYTVYDGAGRARGPKSRDLAIVHDGMLTLRATQLNGVWTGSGLNLSKVTTGVYGRYVIRMRYSAGFGAKAVALLWPTNGWPPEVDWAEFSASDASHTTNSLTNHYSAANKMQHAAERGVDFSTWHTVGLWWLPNELVFRLDGQTVFTITDHVPAQPMWVGLSNNLGRNGVLPDDSTPANVDFDIDYFHYYAYNPTA